MKVGRPHKVDLNKPEKIILVQIFNKACGVSVINADKLEKYRGYNIRMFTDQLLGIKKETKKDNNNSKSSSQTKSKKELEEENEKESKIFKENTEIEFKQVDHESDSESSDSGGIDLF